MAPRIPTQPTDNLNRNPDQSPEARDQLSDNSNLTQRNPEGHLSEPTNPSSGNNVETLSPSSEGLAGGMIGEG